MSGFGGLSGDSDDVDIDQLLTGFQDFRSAAARSAQQMAIQTADACSKDRLVHVWVNARGVVVQVEFDDALLAEATGPTVGAAVVEAAQAAAAKMRAKTDSFQAGLWQRVAQLGVSPLQDAAEFEDLQPEVPLSAPDSRERRVVAAALDTQSGADFAEDAQDWQLTIRDKD
ncbi:YbaB/EbfC family nucleoid-associated protein [Mycobacterium sp. 1423905.2]|uniref:YbaB/EbfC family nucleoid-associated protein n=1 Tax=Mycobacterium sp. 1423905.2 TaxID=1856859 RepID=UPI001C12A911|nr:YbaB/EbfC family nucleoid-associated protein [Mycobacterium sp. 1423905.2]